MTTTVADASGQFTVERRTNWRPKLKSGYFFIKDRKYFLYARKSTVIFRDTMELRHPLVGMPTGNNIEVLVEGVKWSNYRIEGRDLVVSLQDLESQAGYWGQLDWDLSYWDFFKTVCELNPDNYVRITYEFRQWDSTNNEYITGNVSQDIRIGDCSLAYRMPDDYVRGAPTVITDDEITPQDERQHRLQFHIVEPTRELEFNMAQNLLRNPHFKSGPSGLPTGAAYWYFNTPTGLSRMTGSGYVGDKYLQLMGTGKAIQETVIGSGETIVAEAWMRGSGQGCLELAYKHSGSGRPIVDQSGAVLAYDPNFDAWSYRKYLTLGTGWAQISAVLGDGTEFDPSDALLPDICDLLEFRLWVAGSGQAGATRVFVGPRPRPYEHLSTGATIEYEADPSGFYRPRPRDMFPYNDSWDLDMNPVNAEHHGGFLCIVEEGEKDDEGLGYGDLTWDEPYVYPTGYPQGLPAWPSGMRHLFGRQHLPYAKITGYQKLYQTQVFDLENQPHAWAHVTEPVRSKAPSTILVASPSNLYRAGTNDPVLSLMTYGGLGVETGHLREYVSVLFYDNLGNPIIGDWIVVTPSGQIQVDHSGAFTDRAGRIHLRVGPQTLGQGSGQVTFTHYESGVEGYLKTSMDKFIPL
jgi:hypothetical protein